MSYAVDTHCHLTFIPQRSRKAVIERALKAGVRKMITVACNLEEVGQCIPLTDEYDFIWTTAGIHPTECGENIERDLERVSRHRVGVLDGSPGALSGGAQASDDEDPAAASCDQGEQNQNPLDAHDVLRSCSVAICPSSFTNMSPTR